jgi:hypothetical protein
MTGIPLALTGEYVEPGPGEYPEVLLRLNGISLMRLPSANISGMTHPRRVEEVVEDAVRDFVRTVIEHVGGGVPA